MHVLLSKENQDFRLQIQDLLLNNFKDFKNIILKDLWKLLYQKSFIKEDNSFLRNILLTEAVCKFSPGVGLFLLTQFACIEIIRNFAGNSLGEKYFKKLISGDVISCFSITEPNAGSDVSMIETVGKKTDKDWTLNGHKIWASNASISDIIITFAQTKEIKDKTGITCFLIPTSSVSVSKDTPKLGVKITPSNEIFIKDIKVTEENVIGKLGDGIKIALSAITLGRIFCAAQAVGLMDGILSEAVKHSVQRNQFGKSISDFQSIKWYIADMSKDLDAARLLLYKSAYIKDNNLDGLNLYSSMAKYFSTTAARKHSANAVQILGGKGLIEDSYVASAYKDSKVLEIYEGTNEIQKVILTKELGLK